MLYYLRIRNHFKSFTYIYSTSLIPQRNERNYNNFSPIVVAYKVFTFCIMNVWGNEKKKAVWSLSDAVYKLDISFSIFSS